MRLCNSIVSSRGLKVRGQKWNIVFYHLEGGGDSRSCTHFRRSDIRPKRFPGKFEESSAIVYRNSNTH